MQRGISFALALIALLLVLALQPWRLPLEEARPEQPQQEPAAPAAPANELRGPRDDVPTSRRAVAETSDPQALPTLSGAILVRVRHAERAAPAPGIGLLVRPAGLAPAGRLARTARTARDGTARFASVPEGRYEVVCDRGPRAEVDVAGERTAEVELALAAGLRVRGIALDEDGNPVPYAAIRLGRSDEPEAGALATHCASDGTFTLEGLGRGLTVGAEAPGAGTSFLHLLDGEVGDEIFLRLVLAQGSCSVRGRVVDPNDAPVANAQVHIYPAHNRAITFGGGFPGTPSAPLAQRVPTDAYGRFVADGVSSGQVPLSAEQPPFVRGFTVAIVVPGRVAEVTIRLQRGACVSGVVRDPAGRPVAGALVEWLDDRDQVWGSTATEAHGAYRLEGIEAGRCSRIRAQARGLGRDTANPKLGAGDELRLDFRLPDARMVRGRVLDAAGQPLAAWSVFTRSIATPLDSLARTDARGRFGPVQLYPWADQVDLVAGPGPRQSGQPLAEWKGEWTHEEIELRVPADAGTYVTGRVLAASGAPLAGARVVQSRSALVERCDAHGRFRVGPLVEDDQVWIIDPAALHAPHGHRVQGLKDAETLDLGDVQLERGALLLLRLQSPAPLPRLCPELTLERAGREPRRTDSELAGRLLTSRVPVELGAWNLTFEIAGFETVRESIVVTNDPRPAATITLHAKK